MKKIKQISGIKRFFRIFIIVIIVIGAGYFFWKYYFVFGEGTKAGQLNFIVKKGYLFKTYEGRIIQTGYKSNIQGSIQSNEFDFSVVDEKVATMLMSNSGAMLELHYKEYLGAPPWRGMSKYIVDSIISIHRVADSANPLP
ncbi:MAG: hypothetical protein JWM28_1036 [Chitinophagaceae bacterium]|nr:hypothetical protein [Chitinophagaceae bacterium]